MKRLSTWGFALGLVLAAGSLLLAGGAAATPVDAPAPGALVELWDGTSWAQQSVASPDGTGTLTAVAAVSASDVWAVGSYGSGGVAGVYGNALAEHWDGSSWQPVAMPQPAEANEVRLNGLAAVSAADVWAVGAWAGAKGGYSTLLEHWDGSSWSIVGGPSPGISAQLSGVVAVSPSDVWAVGSFASARQGIQLSRTLVLHWDGTTWTRVPSPHPGSQRYEGSGLAAVAAVSPTSIWAVGAYARLRTHRRPGQSYTRRVTLSLHWNGRHWTQVASPNALSWGNELSAVAAVGRNDLWAAGGYSNGGRGQPLAEHWTGHAWRIVPASSGFPDSKTQGLTSLAVLEPNDIWSAGYHQHSDHLCSYGLVEHWDGGAWKPVPSLSPDTDHFSAVPAASPTAVWAVGSSYPGC